LADAYSQHMRWLVGILSMALAAAYAVIGCSKTTDVVSAADAGAETGEETFPPTDASASGTPLDGPTEEDGDDSAFGGTGGLCIPSDQYSAAESCPPIEAGTLHTTFSCDLVCYSVHRILDGPLCAVGGFGEAGPAAVIPVTEAGTIVLCCPGVWDAAVPCEWFPKQ
jgi:hypothetical protein